MRALTSPQVLDDAGSRPRRGRHRATEWVLATAVALLACAPFLFAARTGALSVPFLDDWAYLRIVRHDVLTGDLAFIDWNDVNFLGLVPFTWLSGSLFGTGIVDFKPVSVVSYVALVAGIWAYARLFVARVWALFCTAAVMSYPPFGYLAVTLMTDLPSIACQTWCTVLGITALRADEPVRRRRLVVALAIGLLGFTIRQQAVVAPLAVLCLLWVRGGRARERSVAVTATVAVLAAGLAFTLWRASFPLGGHSLSAWPPTNGTGSLLTLAIFTAGFLLPVLVLAAARAWPDVQRGRLVLLGSSAFALAAIGAVLMFREFPFGGNGVTRYGAIGGNVFLSGGRHPVVPLWVWLAFLAAVATGTALAAVLSWHGAHRLVAEVRTTARAARAERVAALDPRAVVVAASVVLCVGLLVLNAYANFFVFDRYAAPLVILVVAPLVAWTTSGDAPSGRWGRWSVAAAAATLVLLSVVSLSGTWDAQSFAHARWEAGERARSLGIPADRIDAGAEWVGYHYRARLQEHRSAPPDDGLPPAPYRDVVPRFRRSLVVLDGPLRGRAPLFEVRYSEWFGLAQRTLYGYPVASP
ncbi:MAG: hypothetical protein QOI54_3143 [Actinomycetota bacterium]|nr:hypothetical protein [Actinomycetota bacterium]